VDGQAGCRCSQFQTRSTILSARVSLASSRSRRRASLEIELLVLRDQLVVLRRQRPVDRGFTEAIACCGPGSTELGHLLESDGAGRARNRGQSQGFGKYRRWRSKSRGVGLPGVNREIRELIRQMSTANPLWGAPRIHCELLKLGIEVSQATVGRYVIRRQCPASPIWRSFLHNQIDSIAAIDMLSAKG
jgi:hypothetical protein